MLCDLLGKAYYMEKHGDDELFISIWYAWYYFKFIYMVITIIKKCYMDNTILGIRWCELECQLQLLMALYLASSTCQYGALEITIFATMLKLRETHYSLRSLILEASICLKNRKET